MKPILPSASLAAFLLFSALAPAQEEPPAKPQAAAVITANSAGAIKLGMTIAEARDAVASATFERSSDAEGIAFVDVSTSGEPILRLHAGEEDAEAALDEKAVIDFIGVLAAAYQTAEGVRPGMSVWDAEKAYGKTSEVVMSELESREYITFTNHPAGLSFRLSHEDGFAGVYREGDRVTTTLRPGSKIAVIEVTGAEISEGAGASN